MLENCKIVVVDNSEELKNGISKFYENSSVKVVEYFSDTKLAYDYISGKEVDVVITDLILPNSDGYAFIEELKKYL